MSCRTIDELIRGERLLGLSPAERSRLEAHLVRCARCRAIVRPDLHAEPVQPPPDLLASILEQTAGPACGRAGELLASRLDGDLEDLDARLVEAHTADCPECDALATAFARLAEELPAMRDLEPDAAFASRVLALTSGSPGPRGSRSSHRISQLWNRLVQRPRLAWEAAYVGAMLFWLLLGAPLVRLPGSPGEIRAYLPDLDGTRSVVRAVRDPVSELGRRTFRTTREELASKTDDLRHDLQRSGATIKAITDDAREVVIRLIEVDDHDGSQE